CKGRRSHGSERIDASLGAPANAAPDRPSQCEHGSGEEQQEHGKGARGSERRSSADGEEMVDEIADASSADGEKDEDDRGGSLHSSSAPPSCSASTRSATRP